MSLVRKFIIPILSWLWVLGTFAWAIVDGGFEPWLASGGGVLAVFTTSQQYLPGIWRDVPPEKVIENRDKFRPAFRDFIQKLAREDGTTDVIVHDVNRLDSYPESGDDNSRRISGWFRVGLMDYTHRGVLLGLGWTYIEEQSNGRWLEVPRRDTALKVMLIGEVPYEAIESVNFDGDEYYNKPHIFCHFDYKGEPYDRKFYGEQFVLGKGLPYHYREVDEYKSPSKSRWKFWQRSNAV